MDLNCKPVLCPIPIRTLNWLSLCIATYEYTEESQSQSFSVMRSFTLNVIIRWVRLITKAWKFKLLIWFDSTSVFFWSNRYASCTVHKERFIMLYWDNDWRWTEKVLTHFAKSLPQSNAAGVLHHPIGNLTLINSTGWFSKWSQCTARHPSILRTIYTTIDDFQVSTITRGNTHAVFVW